MRYFRKVRVLVYCIAIFMCTQIAMTSNALNSNAAKSPITLEEPPVYGVYFEKQEPAFYTGFAPRCQDPERIHLHVARGNQFRVTVVMSPETVRMYAEDLLYRSITYRQNIEEGKLVLTQNRAFEEFERVIIENNIENLVQKERTLPDDEIQNRNLQLMKSLNPGRVFHIRINIDELIRLWVDQLEFRDVTAMSSVRRLTLINLLLPTRLWLSELNKSDYTALQALVSASFNPTTGSIYGDVEKRIWGQYLNLLASVSLNLYPVQGDYLDFHEFTAIYPIGTLNDFTTYKGKKIPLFPAPGIRTLTTHQRSQTVDHIPTINIYSFFPWIPYMHVGPKLHNSFHSLWWTMETMRTSFLPQEWRQENSLSRNGKPLPCLYLLSRGPMSHGCTHLNAGHISEFRQILPSETEPLYQIKNYRTKSHLYDVFDIDGDLKPEVMGVKYYIAFTLKNKKPDQLRVRDERHTFYDWLYAGDISYRPSGQAYLKEATDAQFIGRRAVDGRIYTDINLYEADYEPERVQFFRMVDIPFIRELRKTAVPYPNGDLIRSP